MRKLTLVPILLCACLEAVPRDEVEAPVQEFPSSISDCWWAYICFDSCESDFDCAGKCRDEYPDVATQAGEALYQATRWGETDAQEICFLGGFG